MFRKRYLIVALILIIGSLGCKLLSGGSANAEVVFDSTPVGVPEGPGAKKDIGPEGGSLASPDGRLTLTVPQNALSETVPFSIQPITNKAGNGIGLAYRLEPDGRTFPTPLEISVRYDERDLEGTVPQALSLAYQDGQGAWRAQKAAKLDQNAKTLSIRTTHFTDLAFLSRLRLSPAKATLHVGESQVISLVMCEEPGFIGKILSRPANCTSARSYGSWRIEGAGTFGGGGGDGKEIYNAPGKKPTPNIAYVIFSYELEVWDESKIERVSGELGTTITILDRGYRASGKFGDTVVSGEICDLEAPFTIDSNNPFIPNFKFSPSSPTAGSWNIVYTNGVIGAGGGQYTVEGSDTEKTGLVLNGSATATIPRAGTGTGSGTIHIDLVPLNTDECGGG